MSRYSDIRWTTRFIDTSRRRRMRSERNRVGRGRPPFGRGGSRRVGSRRASHRLLPLRAAELPVGVAVGGWLRPQHGTQTVDGDDVHDVVRPLVVTLPGDADPSIMAPRARIPGGCAWTRSQFPPCDPSVARSRPGFDLRQGRRMARASSFPRTNRSPEQAWCPKSSSGGCSDAITKSLTGPRKEPDSKAAPGANRESLRRSAGSRSIRNQSKM